jgi:hypothetical protein
MIGGLWGGVIKHLKRWFLISPHNSPHPRRWRRITHNNGGFGGGGVVSLNFGFPFQCIILYGGNKLSTNSKLGC